MSVSQITQHTKITGGNYYEQRIPLPCKVMHQFATALDGDRFFEGLKFVKYGNGSVFMYIKILGEVKDSYTQEECKPAPVTKFAKTLTVDVPVAMDVSSSGSVAGAIRGATVFQNEFHFDDAGSQGCTIKCHDTTPIGSPSSQSSNN